MFDTQIGLGLGSQNRAIKPIFAIIRYIINIIKRNIDFGEINNYSELIKTIETLISSNRGKIGLAYEDMVRGLVLYNFRSFNELIGINKKKYDDIIYSYKLNIINNSQNESNDTLFVINSKLNSLLTSIIIGNNNGIFNNKAEINKALYEGERKISKNAFLDLRNFFGKTNFELTKFVSTSVGIDTYIWRGMNLPNSRDYHKAQYGKIYSYKEKVLLGNGRLSYPGEEKNCVCYAVPNKTK